MLVKHMPVILRLEKLLIFNIILRNDSGVFDPGLVKKISGVSLLEKGITDVFLVAENLVDGACVPS